MSSDLVGDLCGETGPPVVHGEHNAEHLQGRVEHSPNEGQRGAELGQTVERVVLALDGYEDGVGRGQAVDGEKPERRRAVEKDVVECVLCAVERCLEPSLPCQHADQLDLSAGEVHGRRRYRQVVHGRIHNHREKRRAILKAIVYGADKRGLVHADAAGGVGLGIRIHKKHTPVEGSQAGPEVDRGRRLADPALLVDYCDDAAQCDTPTEVLHTRAARCHCQGNRIVSA